MKLKGISDKGFVRIAESLTFKTSAKHPAEKGLSGKVLKELTRLGFAEYESDEDTIMVQKQLGAYPNDTPVVGLYEDECWAGTVGEAAPPFVDRAGFLSCLKGLQEDFTVEDFKQCVEQSKEG